MNIINKTLLGTFYPFKNPNEQSTSGCSGTFNYLIPNIKDLISSSTKPQITPKSLANNNTKKTIVNNKDNDNEDSVLWDVAKIVVGLSITILSCYLIGRINQDIPKDNSDSPNPNTDISKRNQSNWNNGYNQSWPSYNFSSTVTNDTDQQTNDTVTNTSVPPKQPPKIRHEYIPEPWKIKNIFTTEANPIESKPKEIYVKKTEPSLQEELGLNDRDYKKIVGDTKNTYSFAGFARLAAMYHIDEWIPEQLEKIKNYKHDKDNTSEIADLYKQLGYFYTLKSVVEFEKTKHAPDIRKFDPPDYTEVLVKQAPVSVDAVNAYKKAVSYGNELALVELIKKTPEDEFHSNEFKTLLSEFYVSIEPILLKTKKPDETLNDAIYKVLKFCSLDKLSDINPLLSYDQYLTEKTLMQETKDGNTDSYNKLLELGIKLPENVLEAYYDKVKCPTNDDNCNEKQVFYNSIANAKKVAKEPVKPSCTVETGNPMILPLQGGTPLNNH